MIRILLGSLLFVLFSCKQDLLVTEKWKFDNSLWLNGDKKSMMLQAPDTTGNFKLDVIVRHDEKYRYQNLYVRTITTYPSGKEVSSVTSLELANNDGSWAGDCSQQTCKVELPLQKHFNFPELGSYTWTIEPFMRIDTVMGIKSLTVLCRTADK